MNKCSKQLWPWWLIILNGSISLFVTSVSLWILGKFYQKYSIFSIEFLAQILLLLLGIISALETIWQLRRKLKKK